VCVNGGLHMNVVLDPQPNCIVNLQIEIPPERVAREWLAVAKNFQRQARIPGYRPGKAPQTLIDSRYAKDIRETLQENLLSESLTEAIKLKNLSVISAPTIQEVDIGDDKTMRFRARVVVAPEFEIPDYSAISLDVPKREATDADVDGWVNQLREPHATFETVDGRPLAMGDYAVLTYEGKIGDRLLSEILPKAPVQLHGRPNAWILMDEGTLIPGFAKAVEGMLIGDERTFTLDVPATFPLADLRGEKVSYSTALHAINVKTLPPLDDDLAEKIEPGQTMESLRADIRERLVKIVDDQFEGNKRRAVLDHLLAQIQCELPVMAIAHEASGILREIVEENRFRGVGDAELKAHEGELVGLAQKNARERVGGNFLLLRIAEKEKLEVSESDLVLAVTEMAHHHEIPLKKLITDLRNSGGIQPLREKILMRKALDLVASHVTVREPASPVAAA